MASTRLLASNLNDFHSMLIPGVEWRNRGYRATAQQINKLIRHQAVTLRVVKCGYRVSQNTAQLETCVTRKIAQPWICSRPDEHGTKDAGSGRDMVKKFTNYPAALWGQITYHCGGSGVMLIAPALDLIESIQRFARE